MHIVSEFYVPLELNLSKAEIKTLSDIHCCLIHVSVRLWCLAADVAEGVRLQDIYSENDL